MTVKITRQELDSAELRREAARCESASSARRMLALALVMERTSRSDAARATGMDRQTLQDWVLRWSPQSGQRWGGVK